MAALGMSLAPDDYPLDPSPTWERIDTTYNVTGPTKQDESAQAQQLSG
jgi:hypothetical protein